MGTISMSRGSGWTYKLRGKPGDWWPESGETQVVFYDSTGGVIAEFDGELSPEALSFEFEPDDVAGVPHGSGFELFVTPDETGIPQLVRYGVVARREVLFPDAPATTITDSALYFGDEFKRTLLGPKWLPRKGKPQIYINSGDTPNGVAAAQQLLGTAENAAMLFYQPLNGDDLTMHVKFAAMGDGQATMCFCADYNMTSYLGIQVVKSWLGLSNKVRIVKGTGPMDMTSVATVDSTATDSDTLLIKYNSLVDQVQVFKNNSTTALLSYTDSSHTVPHGGGFRYVGMNFETGALFGTGPQICAWTAKDGL